MDAHSAVFDILQYIFYIFTQLKATAERLIFESCRRITLDELGDCIYDLCGNVYVYINT